MRKFLRLTKIKIVLTCIFVSVSFIAYLVNCIFVDIIINQKTIEEIRYFIENVLPAISFALTILKFYLFACLAIYFINKAEKTKLNNQNAKN